MHEPTVQAWVFFYGTFMSTLPEWCAAHVEKFAGKDTP